jgi:hypothetical protein
MMITGVNLKKKMKLLKKILTKWRKEVMKNNLSDHLLTHTQEQS